MTEELNPVNCGCGGEAEVFHVAPEGYAGSYCVRCVKCLTQSPFFTGNKEKAIETWNRAMARMTGHWISVESETVNGKCSVCGYESRLYENDVYGEHYCPNCGARLRL